MRVKVTFDIPEGYLADPLRPLPLEVALINLAVNARDAMPGDGALDVSARNLRAAGADYVEIDVTDTGDGIEPAVLKSRSSSPFTRPSRSARARAWA